MRQMKKHQLDQLIQIAHKHQALKLPILLFLLCGIAVCTVDEKCGQGSRKKSEPISADNAAKREEQVETEHAMTVIELAIAESDAKARAAALQIMVNLANQIGECYEKKEEVCLPDFCQEPEDKDEDEQVAMVATKILALVLNQTKEEIRARVSILTRAPSMIKASVFERSMKNHFVPGIDDG